MKNAWRSGRGKKGTGTKFRKGGENSSQSPFCALMIAPNYAGLGYAAQGESVPGPVFI